MNMHFLFKSGIKFRTGQVTKKEMSDILSKNTEISGNNED